MHLQPTPRPSLRLAIIATLIGASPHGGGAAPDTQPAAPPLTQPAMTRPASTRPAHTNRLANEKSPYLLQHAHNPVDWYPWGEAAFAKAKAENKPIFLSVGYSTCHWCHVMERESFEDPQIAKLLNEGFVPVKVDREERPDVDRMYMAFVQATTGSGGWPMTVILTPDGKPIAGGTYFPPEDKFGRPGMKTLLPRVTAAWEADQKEIVASADRMGQALKDMLGHAPVVDAAIPLGAPDEAFERFSKSFDADAGGFEGAPKFPEPSVYDFLLHYADRKGEPKAREMAIKTLREMARGGIYDHLGGGFHRYSTDARWFLPHFEKMLYDQGQVANLYLDAYALTGEPQYAEAARGVIDYVLRDLTGERGEFYSAEDADSASDAAHPGRKSEGAFYVWTEAEIDRLLGADAAVFKDYFGVKPEGNVQDDPHGEFGGKNVLFIASSAADVAKRLGKTPDDVARAVKAGKDKLFAARSQRPRPLRDDKVLTSWNGLMISACARAGVILQEPRYTTAAVRAADFVRQNLYDPKTHNLTRRWRDGHADVGGFLEDYACYITSLIDLYESTLDIRWLKLALDLQTRQDALFWDKEAGGYFTTAGTDEKVFLRMKGEVDSAEPSGNSVAALNLLRLAEMTDDAALRTRAEKTITAFTQRLKSAPGTMPRMLTAIGWLAGKPRQIVLAGDPTSDGLRAMLHLIHKQYLPHKVILGADGGEGHTFLAQRLAFIRDITPINNKPTAYVCENYACQAPTTELATLAEQIGKKE